MRTMVLVVLLMGVVGAGVGSVRSMMIEDAAVYAMRMEVIGEIEAGAVGEVIETKGRWCLIRARLGGELRTGIVAVSAVVRQGERFEALRDQDVFATERRVIGQAAAGMDVEVVALYGQVVAVRYKAADDVLVEGLVAASAIEETEELVEWRERLAADAEEERAYQVWRYRYAKVAGEFVRLPEFDLRRASSDPDGGIELPAWKVGEFGHVPYAMVEEVFGDERALVRAHIYETVAITHGGTAVVQNAFALRSLESATTYVQSPVVERLLLVGWSMREMADKHELWDDPTGERAESWIAIIGNYTYETPIGAKVTVLRAIPLVQVRRGLTRDEFSELRAEWAAERK